MKKKKKLNTIQSESNTETKQWCECVWEEKYGT